MASGSALLETDLGACMHAGQVDRAHLAKQRLREHRAARGVPACSAAHARSGGRCPLEEQLLVYTAADEDPVPPQLLRKYIAYARAHVHPVLSDDAKQVWHSNAPALIRPSLQGWLAESFNVAALLSCVSSPGDFCLLCC